MSKEAIKVVEVSRRQMNRVTVVQRSEMMNEFVEIADGNKVIYNKLVESYDKNHLVVGTRFDNWLAIKESSKDCKTLCETMESNFTSLNNLIESQGILLNKKGSDLKGFPKVSHKVEVIIPKD